jgi:hypothetical protein
MNTELVRRIANAVLYEGYLLYPYRASALKNRYRWTIGVLHSRQSAASTGERSRMATQVLVAGEAPRVDLMLRFMEKPEEGDALEREIPFQGFELREDAPRTEGPAEISANLLRPGLWRLTLRVTNDLPSRHLMASVHVVLSVQSGEFISLQDPEPDYAEAAAACLNDGLWPVLVGAQGLRDTMLCSPIILYDYPQVARESAGDLFDSTEIDEILCLRILTLTEEEKREIRSGDGRARGILERTEALSPEHWMKLHGAIRGLRKGARVRLHPRRTADILDSVLAGKIGMVESVERDLEDNLHVAVVLEDDPGRDLGELRQPGHRFFFSAEEVELER